MLRSALGRLARSVPARDAAFIGIRYVAARASAVVTLILAAWVFPISAFAAFGTYVSAANLAWLAIFLRYDSAVLGAANLCDARALVRLCVVVGLVLWAVLSGTALALAVGGVVPIPLGLFFAAGLFARAVLRLAMTSATREGAFQAIGQVAMVQAAAQPAMLIALASVLADPVICLVAADTAGHLIAAAWLARHQQPSLSAALSARPTWAELARQAREWRSLPLLNLPSSFVALAFVVSPYLALPLVASPAVAGAAALALRIFEAPAQIIGAALTPVLMNRLRPDSSGARPGLGARQLMGLAFGTGGLFAAGALGLILAGPLLAGTGLGAIGGLVPYAALFQAGVAVAGPLAEACSLFREQRILALVNAGSLAAAAGAAGLAWAVSPEAGLLVLGLVAIGRAALVTWRLQKLAGAG